MFTHTHTRVHPRPPGVGCDPEVGGPRHTSRRFTSTSARLNPPERLREGFSPLSSPFYGETIENKGKTSVIIG